MQTQYCFMHFIEDMKGKGDKVSISVKIRRAVWRKSGIQFKRKCAVRGKEGAGAGSHYFKFFSHFSHPQAFE